MNRLARHEQAQNVSRRVREQSGARTLSFSTREVMDYLLVTTEGCTAVEIKTGVSRLSPYQKRFVQDPPLPVIVEHWDRVQGVWTMVREELYAPKARL